MGRTYNVKLSVLWKMSRYPHRAFAEKQKRVQIQNCMEDKFLKQKLDSISREKLYINKELRRISLAKSSLLESLDRFNTMPGGSMPRSERLSLPCLLDGPRRDHNTRPISAIRRHTMPTSDTEHSTADCKQHLKPLRCNQFSLQSRKDSSTAQSIEETTPRSALRVTRHQRSQEVDEFRVASPITASLILSGQVDKNRANNETSLFPWQGSLEKSKTGTPFHLPKVPDSPTKRDLNPPIPRKVPAGQENSRDGMLATNLKSKFRQIGSVVMATAILRIAADKKVKPKNNWNGGGTVESATSRSFSGRCSVTRGLRSQNNKTWLL